MKGPSRTNQQLLEENAALKRRIKELEQSEADRKLVEEGLRFSRQQLQLLVDSGPDFFFLKDLDLRYQLVNDANARFFGRDKADILGRTDMELMPEAAAVACQESDRLAIRENRLVIAVETVGGKIYETYKFPIIVGDEIVGLAGIIRDITERRRTEEELRAVRGRYRLLFEHAPDGILIVDPATARFVEFNEAAHRQLGYSREEFAKLSIPDIEVIESPEETLKHIENIIRKGRDDFETMHRTRQGEIRNIYVTAQVTEVSGRSMYHCVWRDITARKQAEEALRESEGTLWALINATQEALVLIDTSGTVLVANEVTAQRLGKTAHDLVGTCLYDQYPPDVAAYRKEAFDKVAATGEPVHFIDTREGRFYELYAYPVFAPNGRVSRIAIFAYDITERKQEQDEKARLESQLLQSQKMEAIGTLAGGIAHDFNNILAGIIGFTEMVQDDMPPDSREYRQLGLVLKGAQRGRDLVRQILTFSRQAQHEQKPVALSGIVEEGLKLLRPLLPATTKIRSKGMTGDDIILADSAQMHQVLMNLCTNGSQAMGKKGGLVEIGVSGDSFKKGDPVPSPGMKAGDYITLTIRDTGCGMKHEVLERIFDPFFTTKAQGGGTGLGLSVVHGIVKSHDGFIKVESEPGKGSVFSIYLPKAERQEGLTITEEPPVRGGKERILFVDDEDIIVELNNERLTQLGYEVMATTSSLEALEIFKKEPRKFDLVITDYTMPEMTGVDLARKLLKMRKDIPIILCTGYNDNISADKAKRVGIKEFLFKPQGKHALDLSIRRVLDMKTE